MSPSQDQRHLSAVRAGAPQPGMMPGHAEAPWLVQLKHDVAGLSYDQQVVQLTPAKGQAAKTSPPGEEAATATPLPAPTSVKAGMFGMVTEAVTLKATDGGSVNLKAGEAVQVVKVQGAELLVKTWSGHGGTKGTIPKDKFKEQPRIGDKEGKNEPEDYVYKTFKGELFLGPKDASSGKRDGEPAPRLEDVLQGSLGDCYLLASMGAVVAARPDIIQDMVKWDEGQKLYSVTFQELQDDGTFKPHVEWVDANLPTELGGDYPKYAGNDGKKFDPKDQALWPSIIEKAYAQWKGGYKALEEHGGLAEEVMTALTGGESGSVDIPSTEKALLNLFKQIQKDQKPACAGSRNYMKETNKEGLFVGGGTGPFAGTLVTEEGTPAELVKGKVKVADQGGPGGSASDNKTGSMKGASVSAGSVDHESGRVELTYKKDKAPKKAENLKASYQYHGLLSPSLNIHGEHYYIFREVKDNKIVLHNPWGPDPSYQPKPMSAAEFIVYFDALDVNTPPPAEAVRET